MYLCEKRHKDIHYFHSSNIYVRLFSKNVRFFSFLHKIPIKTQQFRPIGDILKMKYPKTRKVRQTNCRTFILKRYHFGLMFAKNRSKRHQASAAAKSISFNEGWAWTVWAMS